ncbi:MAG: nitrogen fixation protein NifZ, partial [Ketobacteraceae bacterium]|nr:nitrogen fixation protein NifZ [Ketobacteraceae bacterium]
RVHFLEAGRTVGCREEELIPASDPWIANKYEFRDKVICNRTLMVQGEIIAEKGDSGEVEKIIKQQGREVLYHIRFSGRVFRIPESVLSAPEAAMTDPQRAVDQ